MAPRAALAAAAGGDGGAAAGRAPGDLAWLMLFAVIAGEARALVAAGWLAVEEGAGTGLRALGMVAGSALGIDLVVLLAGAAVVWVAAGRRRDLGVDFDLACVAMVPWVVVTMANDGWVGRGVGGVWVAGMIAMAVIVARGGETEREKGLGVGGAGLGVVGVVLAVTMWNGIWIARNWDAMEPVGEGDPAPVFALPELGRDGELTGARVDLATLKGRVVLLDFWAEWCQPCRKALPVLGRMQKIYGPQGLTVLSVKTDGQELGRARKALASTDFPMVVDDGDVAARYAVTVLPHMVVIDREGVVRGVYRGQAHGLVANVERLLGD